MTYACSYEVPATREMYGEVRRLIGDDRPRGMIVHIVISTENGLRHLEVWESEDLWTRFHHDTVEPAVHHVLRGVGFTEMPPEPPVLPLDVVDIWIGS